MKSSRRRTWQRSRASAGTVTDMVTRLINVQAKVEAKAAAVERLTRARARTARKAHLHHHLGLKEAKI